MERIKIVLSNKYLKSLDKLLNYLLPIWGNKVSQKSIKEIDKHILLISTQPLIGLSSAKSKTVRSVLVSKHNRLYYKIEKDSIVILDIKDTHINPSKNKY